MVGGAVTGASADMTGILHRGAVAPAAPAATLPTEATTATTTTTTVASTTTTTSLAAALPTTEGERGLREADILATTAMADSPATTEVKGTIPATTMATDTTQVLATDTTLAMATTTEEVASETVNVLPTSSAVIFGPATNAQDQTIMVDTKLACLMFILVDQTIMVESTRLTKLACLMFIWVYNYSILIWIYN